MPFRLSNAVVAGDLLFGFSHKNKGQFFCMDARTGATKWLGDPRQGDNAAMLIAGDRLLVPDSFRDRSSAFWRERQHSHLPTGGVADAAHPR